MRIPALPSSLFSIDCLGFNVLHLVAIIILMFKLIALSVLLLLVLGTVPTSVIATGNNRCDL